MSENKECLFYIDYNPPEGCGIWGAAIHKGACRLNSTDCNNTPECFIKKLYEQLQVKEQECLTLINKVNRLEEEKNTLQILLEGKNSQYNAIKQEYEKLKKGANNE